MHSVTERGINEHLIFAQLTGGEPLVTRVGREILKEFATGRYCLKNIKQMIHEKMMQKSKM